MERHLQDWHSLVKYLEDSGAHSNMVARVDVAWEEFSALSESARASATSWEPPFKACWKCGNRILTDAARCPQCGISEIDGLHQRSRGIIALIVVVLFALFIVAMYAR